MRGVVLAGGRGTRLLPMTRIMNKHVLPVFDRPMILYSIERLVQSGIDQILVVTGGPHADGLLALLGDGRWLGAQQLYYACQQEERGIADALALAEGFACGQPLCVLLGDNVFADDLRSQVSWFCKHPWGARVLLKAVPDPRPFGVADLQDGRIVRIIEKPSVPPSAYAVTGIYFYDDRVFDLIRTLQPSARGELEITELNNRYIALGALSHAFLSGWWSDVGTPEALLEAATLAAELR